MSRSKFTTTDQCAQRLNALASVRLCSRHQHGYQLVHASRHLGCELCTVEDPLQQHQPPINCCGCSCCRYVRWCRGVAPRTLPVRFAGTTATSSLRGGCLQHVGNQPIDQPGHCQHLSTRVRPDRRQVQQDIRCACSLLGARLLQEDLGRITLVVLVYVHTNAKKGWNGIIAGRILVLAARARTLFLLYKELDLPVREPTHTMRMLLCRMIAASVVSCRHRCINPK